MRLWAIPAFVCLAATACAADRVLPPAAGGETVAMVDHLQGLATMLKRITVVACAPGLSSPMPTEADAQPLLQRKAASIGAIGILRAKYQPAGLFDGCGLVPALKASGIAFRLAP